MTGTLRQPAAAPEVLVPYTEFDAGALAQELHGLVAANGESLAVRGLAGVVSRYSDPEIARQKVRKGQLEHGRIGHFALVNTAGDVRGAASIYPGLPLRHLRVPISPILARGVLAVDYPLAGPNIHAWTDESDLELLADAYKDLVAYTGTLQLRSPLDPRAWTIEPVRSAQGVHAAIADSGLDRVATRRFDDGESKITVPGKSTLYARIDSVWASDYGKLSEFRTGRGSFLTKFNDTTDDMMSENPRGA